MSLVPKTISEGDNPKGLCPTMYHTGTWEGDQKMIDIYATAKQLQEKGQNK